MPCQRFARGEGEPPGAGWNCPTYRSYLCPLSHSQRSFLPPSFSLHLSFSPHPSLHLQHYFCPPAPESWCLTTPSSTTPEFTDRHQSSGNTLRLFPGPCLHTGFVWRGVDICCFRSSEQLPSAVGMCIGVTFWYQRKKIKR